MMKANNSFIKVFLIGSIIVNIILVILLYKTSCDNKAHEKYSYLDQKSPDCSEIFLEDNYQRIFIERNDSIYRYYYNSFFVNNPGQSFLLACAFYMLNNNNSKDFEPVLLELKGMYGVAPELKLKGGK